MKVRIESTGVSLPTGAGLFRKGSVGHAVHAGKNCFKFSSYNPSEIDVLVNSGIYRDRHIGEPAMAVFIQKDLGINPDFHGKKSFSFDLMNGGCGMLNALHVLTVMIQSGKYRLGMAVSSECNPDRRPDPNFDYLRSGSAILLDISPYPKKGFGSFIFKNFEEYMGLYNACIDLKEKGGMIKINKAKELNDAYLSCAPVVFKEILKNEKLKKDDIDLVIPSQVSADFIGKLQRKLDISVNRILDITSKLKGDTFTTSVFIAFDHALKENIIKPDQTVLFLTFGAGITVGSAVYYV